MMALEWSGVDLGKRQLRIHQSEWKGHVTLTIFPAPRRLNEWDAAHPREP